MFGSDDKYLATVERYDPATNKWTLITSMASARLSFAAAAMGGSLYVTGGEDAAGKLRSCERYDPGANTWSRIADLPEPRCEHALACLGGSLYAVGGFTPPTSPAWRYETAAGAWVAVPLAVGSAAMARFFGWAALL